MTLKEVVLKSLEDINDITNYLAVLNHINEKKYYWTLYTMVMAPDRESMSFKGEFYVDIYDRQRGISPITSTQYNLKRIK